MDKNKLGLRWLNVVLLSAIVFILIPTQWAVELNYGWRVVVFGPLLLIGLIGAIRILFILIGDMKELM